MNKPNTFPSTLTPLLAVTKFRLKRFVIPTVYLVVFLGCAGLRMANLSSVEVREFPDSRNYTEKASRPLWSAQNRFGPLEGILIWWLKGRSPTVPFFYKLVGNTPDSLAKFQLTFSLLSWGVLALVVSRAIKVSWLKLVAFLVIQMFSLSTAIILWDGFILSDSISISLMALFIACWLWFMEGSHWHKGIMIIIVGFFWAFSRDTNAWVLLILAGLLVSIGSIRYSRTCLLLAAAFTLIFIVNEVSQNYSRRWVTPFINVVGKRILPSHEWTDFFERRGMPVNPALMRLSGQLAWSHNRAFYKDPDLELFRDWVYRHGKSTYLRFLLAHLAMTVQDPLRNIERLIAPELSYYRSPGFLPVLNNVLDEMIYPQKWALVWFSITGIMFRIGFVVAVQDNNARWLLPLILIMVSYPHNIALVWHGDPNDVGRHALQASVHFRLGLWILLAFIADRLLSSNERPVRWNYRWRRRLGVRGNSSIFDDRVS